MYWAIDYVDELECELVCNDQLYTSWNDANAALQELYGDSENYEINSYGLGDLEDVYNQGFTINNKLQVLYDLPVSN